MRLAYLITAYDQPRQLARLVGTLQGAHARVYVHVDAHVALEPFRTALAGHANVWLCEPRVAVNWMGFSQVESILRLMARAAADGFDYCVLLSGSDYPIKSNPYLLDFYANANEEFLAFWRLADRPSWMHKVQYWYPIDLVPIREWAKGAPTHYWRRLFWGRFHQWRDRMPRREFLRGLVPYGGSDWWSMSSGCVRHILQYVNEHPEYVRFYRYTHCPSEMFFHTIVLNSPWGERVRNRTAYEAWSAATSAVDKAREDSMLAEDTFNLRYIDWSGKTTGQRETPAVLDDRDWPLLRQSADLFARKFSEQRSASLLDRIDRELLEIAR